MGLHGAAFLGIGEIVDALLAIRNGISMRRSQGRTVPAWGGFRRPW